MMATRVANGTTKEYFTPVNTNLIIVSPYPLSQLFRGEIGLFLRHFVIRRHFVSV